MPNNETLWPITLAKVQKAWDIIPSDGGQIKGKGVLIFHPDTGYTLHPLLLEYGSYLYQYSKSYLEPGKDAFDNLAGYNKGHGTHTASVIISREFTYEDRSYNILGLAPMAKVLPMRVVAGYVFLTDSEVYNVHTAKTLADSILDIKSPFLMTVNPPHLMDEKDYIKDVGVISISLGGWRFYKGLHTALLHARSLGIIACAAGGQMAASAHSYQIVREAEMTAQRAYRGLGFKSYPGGSRHTIGVSACEIKENLNQSTMFSTGYYGLGIDVTAPGVNIAHAHTHFNEEGAMKYTIGKGDGTSYATAFVAGACALWLAFHNRDKLIQKYGKKSMLDAFRYVLYATSNRNVQGYKEDDITKTFTLRPITINLYTSGRPDIKFEMKERWGCGLIDVEALLKYRLPDKGDVKKLTEDLDKIY